MANKTGYSPVRIDTFGADVTISSGTIKVVAIIATAKTSRKALAFKDSTGEQCFYALVSANSTAQFTPARPFVFYKGLIFDDTTSEFVTNDSVYLYLE